LATVLAFSGRPDAVGQPPATRYNDSLLKGETVSMLADTEPPPAAFLAAKPYYPWLVVGTTCLAAFVGQVDASIVQLALPTLEHAFDARLSAVSWVAIAYVLAFAAILPVFARLAETAGRKTMYLAGFAMFGLASAACGLAPSLGWLIAFRALQGASGAMLGANSIVILVSAAGAQRRGQAMGIFAAAQAVGISVGPACGGILLGLLSWHWVFWVSAPFSLAGAVLGWFIVPQTTNRSADRRFDAPGAVLLMPALASLLLAITQLNAWGPLSPSVLGCAAAAAVLLAAFVWREGRAPAPLINLAIFRAPGFSSGGVGVVLSYAMLYGMFFAMSFALVRGYHDAPLSAGIRLAIVPVALGVVAPFSGGLFETHGRAIMGTGALVCAAAAVALRFALTGTPASLLPAMALLAAYGAGLGLFIAPNNTATLNTAPPERSGQAGGLLNLMRAFGTGFGVAAASVLLSWRLSLSIGLVGRTEGAPPAALLAAIGDVLLMLAAFAVVAGAASLVGPGRRAA
jgi:EmrB/QacA subfamily drug resistance transporter